MHGTERCHPEAGAVHLLPLLPGSFYRFRLRDLATLIAGVAVPARNVGGAYAGVLVPMVGNGGGGYAACQEHQHHHEHGRPSHLHTPPPRTATSCRDPRTSTTLRPGAPWRLAVPRLRRRKLYAVSPFALRSSATWRPSREPRRNFLPHFLPASGDTERARAYPGALETVLPAWAARSGRPPKPGVAGSSPAAPAGVNRRNPLLERGSAIGSADRYSPPP